MAIRDRRVAAVSWLTMLKHVTRQTSEPITADKLAAYSKLLADEFGPEAFTQESLQIVADAGEFFPAYAPLRALLISYLAQRRAIALPAPTTLPDWLIGRILMGGQPGPMLTSWFASKSVTPPWPGETHHAVQAKEDWSDPMKVTRALVKLERHPMRSLLLKMLHGLVERHAPENLHLLPTDEASAYAEVEQVAVAFPESSSLFGGIA